MGQKSRTPALFCIFAWVGWSVGCLFGLAVAPPPKPRMSIRGGGGAGGVPWSWVGGCLKEVLTPPFYKRGLDWSKGIVTMVLNCFGEALVENLLGSKCRSPLPSGCTPSTAAWTSHRQRLVSIPLPLLYVLVGLLAPPRIVFFAFFEGDSWQSNAAGGAPMIFAVLPRSILSSGVGGSHAPCRCFRLSCSERRSR